MEEFDTRSSQLHNMSAPSRMRVTVRPLEKSGGASQCTETRVQEGGYQGLRLYTVLNLHCLFVEGFRNYPGAGPKHYSRIDDTQTLLSMLTELAKARLKGMKGPQKILKAWVDKSTEEIEEGFISLCQEINARDFSLPVFGLVKPFTGNLSSTGVITDPLHFVSILCRISGYFFMAGRNPLIPDSVLRHGALGIYRINSSPGGQHHVVHKTDQ